jgi:hypothetical protein
MMTVMTAHRTRVIAAPARWHANAAPTASTHLVKAAESRKIGLAGAAAILERHRLCLAQLVGQHYLGELRIETCG